MTAASGDLAPRSGGLPQGVIRTWAMTSARHAAHFRRRTSLVGQITSAISSASPTRPTVARALLVGSSHHGPNVAL